LENSDVKVLIIDDEAPIREVLKASLEDEEYQVVTASDGVSGLRAIKEFEPDIVLLDIWMPGEFDGIEVLKRANAPQIRSQFIVMSGHGNIETAVKATKLGAWDFVEKPLSMEKIIILMKNILNYQAEREQKNALLTKLRKSFALIGESQEMMQIRQLISRVAPSQSWVLITGENGTGKELVAQNIHYLSERASGPFVEINCAAIPEDLIESELFGHEEGAFTGANQKKIGKFEFASGGTLFLDEIGDMSLKTQAKVLRVLQEKKFERVGGNDPIKADVRLLAATNKDLKIEIAEGRFREDLFYRLNVIPFKMPALRDRIDDIPSLFDYFSHQMARESGFKPKVISDSAMAKLKSHDWPGNVRELKNFIERLYILTPNETIELHDLKFAGLTEGNVDDDALVMANFRDARSKFEREYIISKLKENDSNVSRTAEAIGLERSYLHRKIKSYGIET
jgi:two-component system nitrogen regulation response regulator NtrX